VRGFSESLRHDLAGSRVGVTTVHPGGVATSIAKNARISSALSEAEQARSQERFSRLLKMPPEQAGEIVVAGVEKELPRIIVGSDAKFAALVERLFPVSYWKFIGRGRE